MYVHALHTNTKYELQRTWAPKVLIMVNAGIHKKLIARKFFMQEI